MKSGWSKTAAVSAALLAGLALASCGGGDPLSCDSDAVQERLFSALRSDYPNKASQEMFGYGSTPALDRILKREGLDRAKPADLTKAVAIGFEEAKSAYQNGHYILEDAALLKDDDNAHGALACSGRVVFLTSWAIVVKLVRYSVAKAGAALDVRVEAVI